MFMVTVVNERWEIFKDNKKDPIFKESKKVYFYDTFEEAYKEALASIAVYTGIEEYNNDYKVTHFETYKDAASNEQFSLWVLYKEGNLPDSLDDKEQNAIRISVEKIVTGEQYIF